MILIINICKEEMHYHEFVKPIEDILKGKEEPFMTRRYTKVGKKDLESCHRIIIAGTSLKDISYSKDFARFRFLKSYVKPVLTICGGMQILCMVYGCKLSKGMEIGLKRISFNSEFLGITGQREVYELHNMVVKEDEILKKNFHIYSKNIDTGHIQALKHKNLRQ